jgi:hypothetical protein
VVAPDYEGLGSADMGVVPGHPYLDLCSAGQSMALAAVAAKTRLSTQLSGAWATLGHSQGGHAALAGAQFSAMAAQRDPTLNYRGAVAIAPASQLLSSVNAISQFVSDSSTTYDQALNASASSNLYGAYLIKGSQSTGSPISPEAVLGEKMLSIYKTVETTCLNAFSASIGSDIHQYAMGVVAAVRNYAGLKISAVNEPKVATILAGNDPGQVKLPGSSLIVQGSADTTVLPAITQSLFDKMKAKGSTVTLSLHNSTAATHSGVLGLQDAQDAIAAHLRQIFSGGGGGGGGGEPSPVNNPLSKYVGTYYYCEDNEKSTLTLAANGSDGLNLTMASDVYSGNNCSGSVIGSYRWIKPAVITYQKKTQATMPELTLLPPSDTVDEVSISLAGVTAQLTGSGVSGSCVNFAYSAGSVTKSGEFCYDLSFPSTPETGALYLTADSQYLVHFLMTNGVLGAEGLFSKSSSFNYNELVPD